MTHRPIQPIDVNGFEPGGTPRSLPIFEWVDPGELLVEERYQRDLSERSNKLIRKIVAGWDWSKFKCPIAVLTDAGLELLDGQCTSIAACTHPAIEKIPVMIVEVPELGERAGAFIAHNRDRVAVTAMALHHAAVTAGAEDAQAVQRVCAAASVEVLRAQPGRGQYQSGTTVAVAAIAAVIRERGEDRAVEVMKILAQAGCAPINAMQVKSVDLLLAEDEYSSNISANQIVAAIQTMAPKIEHDVGVFVAAHPSTPRWKAQGILWFKNRRATSARNVTSNVTGNVTDGSAAFVPPQIEGGQMSVGTGVTANAVVHPAKSMTSASKPSASSPNGKQDKRSAFSGWKPGVHLLRCSGCDESYQGDRRSRQCADCAYGSVESKSA